MSHAAPRCKGTEDLEVLLMETLRDLFRAGWSNFDVEILQILGRFLDAVTRRQVTLFLITAERWVPALLCSRGTHQQPPLLLPARATASDLVLNGHASLTQRRIHGSNPPGGSHRRPMGPSRTNVAGYLTPSGVPVPAVHGVQNFRRIDIPVFQVLETGRRKNHRPANPWRQAYHNGMQTGGWGQVLGTRGRQNSSLSPTWISRGSPKPLMRP